MITSLTAQKFFLTLIVPSRNHLHKRAVICKTSIFIGRYVERQTSSVGNQQLVVALHITLAMINYRYR